MIQSRRNGIRTAMLIAYVALLGCTFMLHAQQLAFPGAEGYGKYTTGGRGGAVYEVTNLNSSGTGSFGAAVSASGPRTVVFRVSGTITGNFNISNGNITIAGQTAPGDGICIKGNLSTSADNIIIRYIRVRFNPATGESDAMGGRYQKNIIFDHISASWSTDEVMTLYHNETVTIQWCIISEACEKGTTGSHRFGGIWGNQYCTMHHNLIAHNESRNPRFASGCGYNDYRNNVIYNWDYESCYGGEARQSGDRRTPPIEHSTINMVANYYKAGPATDAGVRDRIANPSARASDDKGSWYAAGNYVNGYPAVTADNWQGVDGSNYIKLNAPWDAMAINQQTAAEAYQAVLDYAGCSLPKRDAVDARIIEEVRTGTATYGNNGIIDSPGDVGGWPVLNSTAAPTDSDHDGMPDAWETENGLNPNSANDRNTVGAGGYTMLEIYLNGLADGQTVKDTIPPTVVSASATNATTVRVTFNEAVAKTGAETKANYSLDNGATVSGASLGADLRTVTLTTSTLASGITYTVTVSNVEDRSGNVMAAAGKKTFEYVPFCGWKEDFNDGTADGWTTGGGSWNVTSGQYQNSGSGRMESFGGDAEWDDITYECDITPGSGTDVWAIFRVQDKDNYYLFTLQSGRLYKLVNGSYTQLATGSGSFSTGTTYHIKVELNGSSIAISSNGTQVLTASDGTFSKGKVGFGSNNNTGTFDNAEVPGNCTIGINLLRPPVPEPAIGLLPNLLTAGHIEDVRIFDLGGRLMQAQELKSGVYLIKAADKVVGKRVMIR